MKETSILFVVVILLLFNACMKKADTETETKEDKSKSNSYVNQLSLNDPDLINDRLFISRVNAYLRQQVFEELANDTSMKHIDNQWNTAKLRVAMRIFTNTEVKDYWLYSILYDQIDNYGIKNTTKLMKIFYENCTNTEYVSRIKELYETDIALRKGHLIKSYKTIDGFDLDAHIFFPKGFRKGDKRPAIIFFHGGSWYQGKVEWTFGACQSYALLGMVAVGAEYRLYDRHGITPLECISDAKSVIRWMRKNAEELGIDPDRIVACGFSSGGHIAACAGILKILDEPFEDLNISSVPNAMVFYYSCFDPTLDRWFVKQVKNRFRPEDVSPNHNIRSGLPPSLVLHGTEDRNCPFGTAKIFLHRMTEAGNRCELYALQGAGHIFMFNEKYREQAAKAMNDFLMSLGYLPS